MSVWNSPFEILPMDGQKVYIRVISVYGQLAEAIYNATLQIFTVEIVGSEIPLYMVSRWKEFTPAPPSIYLLDIYAGSKTAYSVFKLSQSSKYAFQIQRQSDNEILDVPFLNDYVDIGAIITFMGSSNIRASIIYDQSGNNLHMVQVIRPFQPRLSIANVIQYVNSIIALNFNVNTRYTQTNVMLNVQPNTQFIVAALNSGISAGVNQVISGGSAVGNINRISKNSGGNWAFFAGTERISATLADTNQHLFSALFAGASSVLRLDGSQIDTGNVGTDDQRGNLNLGRDFNEEYWNGSIQLAIEFNLDISSDFIAIETYINDLFNIY